MYPELIETIDHKIRLWIELLNYGSQEIQIRDTENEVTVKLQAHKDRRIVSIPSIEVIFVEKITPEELASVAMGLLELLWKSSLEDFCDFYISLDLNHVEQKFIIEFQEYNIKGS